MRRPSERVGTANELRDDLDLAIVSRGIDHDDVGWDEAVACDGMNFRPSHVGRLLRQWRRERRVEAPVRRRMEMGELCPDEKGVAGPARGDVAQPQRTRARHRYRAGPLLDVWHREHQGCESRPQSLRVGRNGLLIELRVWIRRRRAGSRTVAARQRGHG